MRRFLLVAAVVLGGCGGNSDADCQQLCAWWFRYCSGETLASCVADCKDTTESAAEGLKRCVQGQGWGTPSNCRSASCCARFVYSDYNYRQQCL